MQLKSMQHNERKASISFRALNPENQGMAALGHRVEEAHRERALVAVFPDQPELQDLRVGRGLRCLAL